jgi:Protein of unknown function (DUF2442)
MDILATTVKFDENSMWVELSDGRTLGVPYAWFPRLLNATPEQREAVEVGYFGLHWEAIDEDISITGLLAGRKDQTRMFRAGEVPSLLSDVSAAVERVATRASPSVIPGSLLTDLVRTVSEAPSSIGREAPAADGGWPEWLSNLRPTASLDEPEETASKGAETLEALNREIGSLIDNAAAVEMWDRWRRGDTGAVLRRLYTEAGQTAFDELRRRFRADPQFRETTTRYMQEFERLLAKISHSDRDGSQWRAYLLSNTGKVYTILAHAAGKLG